MGRRKTTTVTTIETPVPDAPTAEVEVPNTDIEGDDETLDSILGLNSQGERYTVHKEPSAAGGKREYCCSYTRDELSLDVIRDSFGGGTYRITGYDGNNRLTTSKQVAIISL